MLGYIRLLLGLRVFVGLFHETSMKRGGGDDSGLRVSNGERLVHYVASTMGMTYSRNCIESSVQVARYGLLNVTK